MNSWKNKWNQVISSLRNNTSDRSWAAYQCGYTGDVQLKLMTAVIVRGTMAHITHNKIRNITFQRLNALHEAQWSLSQPVVISVNSLYGFDVDLSCPGCSRLTNNSGFHGTCALFLTKRCQIHFSSYECHQLLSSFPYFLCCAWTTWVMETLSASALSRCMVKPYVTGKDLQVEGITVSFRQPSAGWVRWRSFWGDWQRGRGEISDIGREGGGECWVGVGGG